MREGFTSKISKLIAICAEVKQFWVQLLLSLQTNVIRQQLMRVINLNNFVKFHYGKCYFQRPTL